MSNGYELIKTVVRRNIILFIILNYWVFLSFMSMRVWDHLKNRKSNVYFDKISEPRRGVSSSSVCTYRARHLNRSGCKAIAGEKGTAKLCGKSAVVTSLPLLSPLLLCFCIYFFFFFIAGAILLLVVLYVPAPVFCFFLPKFSRLPLKTTTSPRSSRIPF